MSKRYVSYGDVGTKLQNPRPDVMDNFNPSVPGKTSVQELERDLPSTISKPQVHETAKDEYLHVNYTKPHYREFNYSTDLSCKQVAAHCESCPICKKALMSDNNTVIMYMAIALLVSTLFVIIVKKV